jgi:hypothetical protein
MVRTSWLVPGFYEASGNLDLQSNARDNHVEAWRPRAMSDYCRSSGNPDLTDDPELHCRAPRESRPRPRSAADRRLRLRPRAVGAERPAQRRPLLPLQTLSAPHRRRGIAGGPGRSGLVPGDLRRGIDSRLVSPRRLREALLRRVRLGPVQPPPRRPRRADGQARQLRQRPGGPAKRPPVRRLRLHLGGDPRRRSAAVRRAGATVSPRRAPGRVWDHSRARGA